METPPPKQIVVAMYHQTGGFPLLGGFPFFGMFLITPPKNMGQLMAPRHPVSVPARPWCSDGLTARSRQTQQSSPDAVQDGADLPKHMPGTFTKML